MAVSPYDTIFSSNLIIACFRGWFNKEHRCDFHKNLRRFLKKMSKDKAPR